MLSSIEIKNFLLIDNIKIPFEESFTVITGETGAGKSIIIQALMLALGGKLPSKKLVRANTQSAIIIAVFNIDKHIEAINYLSSLGVEGENELILRRNIYEDGRSKAFINDIPVNLQTLSSLRDILLEVCGQHSSRSLLEKSNHRRLIDEYAGHEASLLELSSLYSSLSSTSAELQHLISKKEKSEIESDFLKHAIKELESLKTYAGEEDELIEKRKSIADKHKITELVGRVSARFNALNLGSELYSLQKDVERGGEIFDKAFIPLRNALSELKEFEAQIEEISNNFSDDLNMEQIEGRLFKIRSIARKYNVLPTELDLFLNSKRRELDEIENLDHLIKKTQDSLQEAKNAYLTIATQVSAGRKLVATELKQKIEDHLKDLKMEKVEIMINVTNIEDHSKWSSKGIDNIAFLVRTNRGLDFSDISKTASGGELSRIMLAIKLALSEKSAAEIIIFDEVDTGISGSVSSAVGKKLYELAKQSQVIAITHQPQVTAFGQNHIHVSKVANDNSTSVHITLLGEEAHLDEIARMISGEKVTPISLEAAKALVDECKTTSY
jgi:DNA repair protein RecN (Recombination protein N)